jgi:hypothetical protein
MINHHGSARPAAPDSIAVLNAHQSLEEALRGLHLVLELGQSSIDRNTASPNTTSEVLADWRVIQGLLRHAATGVEAAFQLHRNLIRPVLNAVSMAEHAR